MAAVRHRPGVVRGRGDGEGYTVSLPVPGGTGDAGFRSCVEHVAVPLIAAWRPELVLISAGFDAHRADPLATCRVTEAFAGMAASLRRAADAVGAPLGLVIEGGYDLGALAGSMAAVMPVLVADTAPDPGPVERHPLASEAARHDSPLVGPLGRGARRGVAPPVTVSGTTRRVYAPVT